MILVIWILLVFPMAVVYDKDKQVRFLACGLLYYIIDAAFNNKRDGK
ncbi:MAG: hypothetical protein V8T39_07410 [Streptococcus lutetiensis]|jgi:hypothetical protein